MIKKMNKSETVKKFMVLSESESKSTFMRTVHKQYPNSQVTQKRSKKRSQQKRKQVQSRTSTITEQQDSMAYQQN